MERRTLAVGEKLTLLIKEVPGDLRLTGWRESQIKAKTNGNLLELFGDGEQVTLSCDNDLIVSVPQNAEIQINLVGGDASLRVLDGLLKVKQVEGDLALRNVGSVVLSAISGDLVVRHASGALHLEQLDGDASIRDVQGDVALNGVGGDLHIRDIHANLHAAVDGDVIANLNPQPDSACNIQADGEVLLRLPSDVDATLSLAADGELQVKIVGVDTSEETVHALTLGSGSAAINIAAGGDLLVTSHADDWADMADFDISLPFIGADFPGLSDDFAETISRHAEETARKAEKAARKVEEKMRKSEHKFREVELHLARTARNAERHVHFSRPPVPPRPPRRPMPPDEPVSEGERLLILKMLQEKKITAAQAEKLLSALE